MKKALTCMLVTLASSSCTQKATAPTPMACETNNSGTIVFGNRSTSFNYDIVWDGVRIITGLAPSATSQPITAAAGVAHTLQFRNASRSDAVACGASPILIRCQETSITCSTP